MVTTDSTATQRIRLYYEQYSYKNTTKLSQKEQDNLKSFNKRNQSHKINLPQKKTPGTDSLVHFIKLLRKKSMYLTQTLSEKQRKKLLPTSFIKLA